MTTSTSLSFTHRFEPASRTGAVPLLLLHGTGGDENDLLPLGRAVAPGSALLSPRGKVLEGGMPRFFRRLAEGVFDEEDVRRRANELADFVAEAARPTGSRLRWRSASRMAPTSPPPCSMLRPEVLAGAVLLRAMVPLADPPVRDLAGKPVLILSGEADPIVPADNAARLAATLTAAGAIVDSRLCPSATVSRRPMSRLTKTWIDQLR